MTENSFKRRLDLSEQQRRELFAHLDAHQSPEQSKRQHIRYTFHVADVPLCIQHPDGGVSRFLVYGRNISSGGIAVLHGGYVHTGSSCQIILRTVAGQHLSVQGVVRHCRLITGSCHEVGILFDEEIDPRRVSGSDASTTDDAPAEELGYESMTGSVLVVDRFAPSRMLLEHHLSMFGLANASAGGGEEAMQKFKAADPPFNLVIVSVSGAADLDIVRELRQTEFVGPIIALTAETTPDQLSQCRQAGANTIVLQPLGMDVLVAHLKAYLGKVATQGPLYSTAEDQPGMRTLVGEYVRGVQVLLDEIKAAKEAKDVDALRSAVLRLRGSGTAFGFNDVTVAAIGVLNDLARTGVIDSANDSLDILLRCCRQISTSKPAEAAA